MTPCPTFSSSSSSIYFWSKKKKRSLGGGAVVKDRWGLQPQRASFMETAPPPPPHPNPWPPGPNLSSAGVHPSSRCRSLLNHYRLGQRRDQGAAPLGASRLGGRRDTDISFQGCLGRNSLGPRQGDPFLSLELGIFDHVSSTQA